MITNSFLISKAGGKQQAMKKTRHRCKQLLSICLIIIILFCIHGCGTSKKPPVKDADQFATRATAEKDKAPKRLITDYQDMQEHDRLSWYWVKTGFRMNLCQSVKMYPLKNYSQLDYPWAEAKLGKALKEILSPYKTSQAGGVDVGVMAAIVEMKAKPGLLKRFSPSIEDHPYVEVEVVIFEETSKTILFKLCHFKKGDDFKEVLQGLVNDLKAFFAEKA
jgi:hypothetical protein